MNRLQFNQLPSALQAAVSYKVLATGEILFNQREPVEAAYYLEIGQIHLVHYTEDGELLHHYTVRAGESFAEVALFKEHYLCTAIADAPSRVLLLPKQAYLAALKTDPMLAIAFMEQLAERLHETRLLLQLRSIRSAQKRVLHYLQLNVQADGRTVPMERPLKEIADDLGLTPEALSRALNQLQKQQVVNRMKRKVVLCKESSKLDPNQGKSHASSIDCKKS
jgi:CRP/FNR family transcriptional regulator, dissimilatory nitrate respiration regulator